MEDNSIQNELIRYTNLLRYEEHRKNIGPVSINISVLKTYASSLYNRYNLYLDFSHFAANYPNQYFQAYLELRVAKFLDDFGFIYNQSIDSSLEMGKNILSNLPYSRAILNLALIPTIF